MAGNYGGDEISALVLDIGSDTVKLGYSGEDCPRIINKTSLAYDPSTSNYKTGILDNLPYISSRDIKTPFKDGSIVDFEVYEKVWQLNFDKLNEDTERPCVLVTEAWASNKEKEKLCEIAIEKFNLPAFYLAKSSVLTCFAAGKTSGLVVDIGASTTSVVPVFDGYVLNKGIFKQNLAGEAINKFIQQDLKEKFTYETTPTYQIKSKSVLDMGQLPNLNLNEFENISESYRNYMALEALNEFKETTCQVFETSFDKETIEARPGKPYEFSDGYNLQFKLERYLYPELLFQPNLFTPTDTNPTGLKSVASLAYQSLLTCEIDTRIQLQQNMVLAGGSTLFQGFNDRLTFELTTLTNGQRVRIAPTQPNLERIYQPWLGGSILSSMGTFHQLWLSKQDYQELGPTNAVEKRFT